MTLYTISDQARIVMITAKLAELDGAIERDQGKIDKLKAILITSEGSEAMIAADVALQNARAVNMMAREQMHEHDGRTFPIRAARAGAFRELEKLEEAEMHLEHQMKKATNATQCAEITQRLTEVQALIEAQETIKQEAEQSLAMDTGFLEACAALHVAEDTLDQARDAYELARDAWKNNEEYRARIQRSYITLLQSQEKLIEQRTILIQELIA